MELSEEEKEAIEILNTFKSRQKTIGYKKISLEDVQSVEIVLNLIEKQQKLINIFIHNEAVREGKDFGEIKEKYYECL